MIEVDVEGDHVAFVSEEGEPEPPGRPDYDLELAFNCVQFNSLPRDGAMQDQWRPLLALMAMVKTVRAQCGADPAAGL